MKILTFIGSLRREAFSRKLARAAKSVAHENISFDFADGRDLPLYDQDLASEEKPAPVQTLLDQVRGAEALLFITPEFNYGIPGPLKNAIDWASRPAYRSPLKGKPSLIIAHSIAPSGGVRAEVQQRNILNGTLTPVFCAPSFAISAVHEKFDETGALRDDLTRIRLAKALEEFETWAGAHPAHPSLNANEA